MPAIIADIRSRNQRLEITLDGTATVGRLAQEIQNRTTLHAADIRIIFGGAVLANPNATLQQLGAVDGSVFAVVVPENFLHFALDLTCFPKS